MMATSKQRGEADKLKVKAVSIQQLADAKGQPSAKGAATAVMPAPCPSTTSITARLFNQRLTNGTTG
jgi:hypothetical protein